MQSIELIRLMRKGYRVVTATGVPVEYKPRHSHDRQPWVFRDGWSPTVRYPARDLMAKKEKS